MRILISAPHLTTTVNVSGVATVVSELIEALRGTVDYHHVLLGSPQNGGRLRRQAASLGNALQAAFKVATTRATVFHSNTALMPRSILRDLPMVLIAKLTGKRVLLHFHGGSFLETKASGLVGAGLKALLRLADVAVFLSETERRRFEAHTALDGVYVRAIYNSIRLPPPELAQTERRGPLRVMFAGRLVPEKGIKLLLAAAINSDPARFAFTIYGDGPLASTVEAAAANHPALCYGGVFAHNSWPHILRNHDVLLLPSTEPFEGMPMILLEGMSLGLVPVATPFGSIPELLGADERGLLIPPGDVTHLIHAIGCLEADPERLASMRAAAMAFAGDHLDIAVSSKVFLSLYSDLSRAAVADTFRSHDPG